MKIFAIMVVKDEADIVGHVLSDAAQWADRIFVLDNGSTDGTWEIVQSVASDVIVPWKQDFRPFSQAIRGEVFNAFRHEARDGDWWCHKLDADEFYVDDPRQFLSRIPRRYHSVLKRSIDYVITEEDVAELQFSGDFQHDRENLRYIMPTAHTERRFIRYRTTMKWLPGSIAPENTGVPHPRFITVKHYQYRSPDQIKKRLQLRSAISRRDVSGKSFRHVQDSAWTAVLQKRDEMLYDNGALDFHQIPLANVRMKSKWYYLKRRVAIALERMSGTVGRKGPNERINKENR